MAKKTNEKILNSFWTFLGAVLVVGPLALPLLWRNPKYSGGTKVLWSGIVVVFTIFLVWSTTHMSHALLDVAQP